MGIGYELVNYTKRECVMFMHIGANTAWELAIHPVTAAITTFYLLANLGDRIAFVSDSYDDWPFPGGSKDDLEHYREMTDELVAQMIAADIIVDEGRQVFNEDEPEIYLRRLRLSNWQFVGEPDDG